MAEDDSMESEGSLDGKEDDDDKGEIEPVTVPPKKAAGRSRKAVAAAPAGGGGSTNPKSSKSNTASSKAEPATPANANQTSAASKNANSTPSDGSASAKKKRTAAKTKSGPTRNNPDEADAGGKRKKYAMTHPRTLDMITEALEELQDIQGSSVQTIRSWIIDNYKIGRTDMLKAMLKRALKQGLASGTLVRPKLQSDAKTLVGRYKIGRPGSDSDPNNPAPPRTNPRPARNQALVKGLGSPGIKKKGKKKKKGVFGKKAKRPGVKPKKK